MSPSPSRDREIALDAVAGEAVLSLAESPTTGYRWRLVDVPAAVEVVESTFTPSAAGGLGRGGERRFTLRLHRAGAFAFVAESARADEPADERVRVTVSGRPPA